MHWADLVAHGVAYHAVFWIEHHEDLVNAELLSGRGPPDYPIVWAALKHNVLAPVIAPVVDGSVRRRDGVVSVGGGSDHCRGEEENTD